MTSTKYKLLNSQVLALLGDEHDALAAASNFVALLYNAIHDINWLGIYVLRDDELILGPFQGKPACSRISLGASVCGTAAQTRQTQRIDDVDTFPGHIVCDPDSRSELVVPLIVAEKLVGVLDIDSALLARFNDVDQRGIEATCESFCALQKTRSRFI